MNATLNTFAIRIIKEQELVIGPLAWSEARKVPGLQVIDEKKGEVNLQDDDPKGIIDKLVAQYERIFGKASHAVCHDAVQDLLASMSPDQVPSSLK
ncbi:MAG TPA: hypothetical protein VGO63_03640 [Candidatus Paceibacterota bacterium]|jgi:hypothetical protein|nr:hypothetical protein [Candidatus Paceibacterota bacterium]